MNGILKKVENINSIYIHIPFCKHICSYCDFCKMYYLDVYVEKYIDALINDINAIPKNNYKTIYIGGGTPSSIENNLLEKLLSNIDKYVTKSLIEYTFECNVEDITPELLTTLKRHHINRISIGVESFNKDTLKYLNRDYDISIKDKIKLTKEYFQNINIDLMYAIPGFKIENLKDDLKEFLSLDIPHISCYSLILEENTVLHNKHIKPINEDLDYEMYKLIESVLEENGFIHYEVSNYSKPGYESNHNLVYWHNQEYYGLGLGASSYVNGVRIDNTRSIEHYLKGTRVINKDNLSINDKMDNEMILGLRTLTGVNKKTFYDKYHCNIKDTYDIMDLFENNMLMENNDNIYIPKDKVYVSNQILIRFLRGE